MDWISNLLPADFLRNSWRTEPCVIKMTAEQLGKFPNVSIQDAFAMFLIRVGQNKFVDFHYGGGVGQCRSVPPAREYLTQAGKSLVVVNNLRIHCEFWRSFSVSALGIPSDCTEANVASYRAVSGCQGFPLHYDAGPLLVYQVQGRRKWVFGTGKGDFASICLEPGDILHLPEGTRYAHKVLSPQYETSLHFTQAFGVLQTPYLLEKFKQDKDKLKAVNLIELDANYRIKVYSNG